MKRTILIVLTVFTVFFGVIGSIQANASVDNATPSVTKRPPLGDDGPGDDDGN